MGNNFLFNTLDNAVSKIQCTDSKEILSAVCTNFFKQAGVDYFMFALCHSSSLAAPDILIIDNLPTEWCEFYHRRGFQRIDPVTSYCFSNMVPIHWHQLSRLPEYSGSQYQIMMHNAKSFGLMSGMSIPLRAATGDPGMLSLISRQPVDKSEGNFNALTPYAMLLTSHLLECVDRNGWLNKEQAPDKIKLTSREYDCLFWACEGKTSWEISKILCISERTVLFHLNNATEKFGAKNRQHAVAKGILGNIIRPKIYPDDMP
ncbi:LuxR family transcriptional regulator [Serratia marcescens]|uniref:helix-turn-helix transcriptional regulator n=1 Tax=Serratia marcescens TaxID=615 RepID=UPI001C599F3E|nr:LuxR family transcriptional regulator [Serratia marcescens]QXX95824.1 LuxR family transcriptional regulator [Serratia marcescens]